MLMLLIRFLGDKLSFQDVADSPELLFFSLMLSATSVGDAIENGKLNKSEALFTNMWCSLLFLAVVSAVLYGCMLLNSVLNLQLSAFSSNLLYFSVVLAVSSLSMSLATQLWIGKVKGDA
jgi:hypothetical protein